MHKQMTVNAPSAIQIKDLYARMLLTRIVDDYAWRMHALGHIDFVASSRGHEAAQVGSAICIEVGKDFTLPYYRDLGVMLTIGMTPYEVFRNYLQIHCPKLTSRQAKTQTMPHWGYHKHNTVTVSAPVATQFSTLLVLPSLANCVKLQLSLSLIAVMIPRMKLTSWKGSVLPHSINCPLFLFVNKIALRITHNHLTCKA